MNAANRWTLCRILLVPVFIACLLYFSPERGYFYTAAVFVYLLACITDALDGYLARKMNQKTALGSTIDPIADKLLLLSGYLSLSLMPNIPESMRVPAWVTLVVISRDVVILAGCLIIFVVTGALKVRPFFIGKITTVIQMGTLFASLLGLPWKIKSWLYFLTVGFTLLSGLFYIRAGGKMFQDME